MGTAGTGSYLDPRVGLEAPVKTKPGISDPAYENFRARRVFGSLDGIRCLSILVVLWHHSTDGYAWLPASYLGFLGVDMFFVLSGFLIVTLLLRERDWLGEISLRRFYLRRGLRIFPVYYGLLAALTLFCWLRPHGSTAQSFFKDLPFYVTYLTNWIRPATLMFIAWSLAMEEQFYLLWPPIEKWLSRSAVGILLVVIAVNQVVNFASAHPGSGGWWDVLTASGMRGITYTPICLGVLLAHVLHSPLGYRRVARILFPPWMSLVVLAALVLTCNVVPPKLAGWPRLSIQLLMMVFLASCVVREDHWLRGLLRFAPVARIGVISYGIYLYHMIACHGALALLASTGWRFPLDQFVLVLLFSWIMAEVSYRYYETPFLRLKDAHQRPTALPTEGVSRADDRHILGAPARSAIPHQRAEHSAADGREDLAGVDSGETGLHLWEEPGQTHGVAATLTRDLQQGLPEMRAIGPIGPELVNRLAVEGAVQDPGRDTRDASHDQPHRRIGAGTRTEPGLAEVVAAGLQEYG